MNGQRRAGRETILLFALELRGALLNFGKIANGDARGETFERRPASRRSPSSIERVREKKKARERETARNAERIRVFHARGFVAKLANQLISPQFALIIRHVRPQNARSKAFRSPLR